MKTQPIELSSVFEARYGPDDAGGCYIILCDGSRIEGAEPVAQFFKDAVPDWDGRPHVLRSRTLQISGRTIQNPSRAALSGIARTPRPALWIRGVPNPEQ